MNFREYLKNHRVIMDGAMGSYYGEKYQKPGQNPELVNLSHPERIFEIHKEYVAAGTVLHRTNSFYSNLCTLAGDISLTQNEREEMLPLLARNISASHAIVKQAIEESGKPGWIAGDIGPVPEHRYSEEEIGEEYELIVDAHLNAGAEILLFETFADFTWLLVAAKYAKSKKEDLFIMASFCLNKFGYTAYGLSAAGILQTAVANDCIDSIGFNCGIGSTHMYQILKDVNFGNLYVSVEPNAGYPHIMKDRSDYQENVEYFTENMEKIANLGVNFIGGCCGTSPAYIAELSKKASGTPSLRIPSIQPNRAINRSAKEHNLLYQKLQEKKKVVLVELDPPHDGNSESILQASLILKQAGADMITVSDSPMGKLRADSLLTAGMIQNDIEISVLPHLACRDRNRLGMGAGIFGAYMSGIRNLLLVTGDPLPIGGRNVMSTVFDFNSIKLMEYVSQLNQEHFSKDPIVFGGAINQSRENLDREIARAKEKVKAGADFFLTQPIYSREDVDKISYIKEQLDTKIICGIMPLVNYRNAMYMKNEVLGIHIPEEIISHYHPEMSREEGEKVGIKLALELAKMLKDVGDGYYFMAPFNRASMIREIMKGMKRKCLI